MSHRYQVTIQGKGFSTVPAEDGEGIVGFFAIRRVRADTTDEAYWTAARALEREEKFSMARREHSRAHWRQPALQVAAGGHWLPVMVAVALHKVARQLCILFGG